MYAPTRTLFGAEELNNLKTHKIGRKKATILIFNGKYTSDYWNHCII